MAIDFQCPGCHSRLIVDDSMAGSQVQCQTCATLISLEGLLVEQPDHSQLPSYQQPSHQQSIAQAGYSPHAHTHPYGVDAPSAQQPHKPGAVQDFGSHSQSSAGSTTLIYAIGGGILIIAIAIAYVIVAGNSGSDDKENQVAQASETKEEEKKAEEKENDNRDSNKERREKKDRIRKGSGQSTVDHRSKLAKQMMKTGRVPNRMSKPVIGDKGTKKSIAKSKNQNGFQPKVGGDHQENDSTWGSDTLRIPFEDESDVTFGPIGCPIVVVKNKVWHLEQKKIVQTLQGEVPEDTLTAISGNGKWFAAADKSKNREDTSVKVWNAATGEVVLEIPGKEDNYVDLIRFSRLDYLLLGGRHSKEIEVHQVSTGKQLPTIVCPTRGVRQKELDFTFDGKYFTGIKNFDIIVVDTKTKNTAAVMEPAKDKEGLRLNLALLKFVKFAPDGQELAAVVRELEGPRLLVWNSRGKLFFDKTFPRLQHVFFFDPRLEWLPDKSGWIISGHIVDRNLKRIVFGVRLRFAQDPLFFPLNRTQLVGSFPYDPEALQIAEIPWKDINESINMMKEGAEAILSPSQKVGLRIEMNRLGGNSNETENLIRETFVKRLSDDGLQVGATGKATFVLRMSEKAGDTLPIYERQNPFDFRGRNTGRSATEVEGRLVIELVYENKILWRDTVQASSSRMFTEPITNSSIRKSMLDVLARYLDRIAIPYFIPHSEKHLALPVIIK